MVIGGRFARLTKLRGLWDPQDPREQWVCAAFAARAVHRAPVHVASGLVDFPAEGDTWYNMALRLNLGHLTIGEIYDHGWLAATRARRFSSEKLDPNEIVLSSTTVRLTLNRYPAVLTKTVSTRNPEGFTRALLAEEIANFHMEHAEGDERDEYSTYHGTLDGERCIHVDWTSNPVTVHSSLDY
jgi:hypothetical protein